MVKVIFIAALLLIAPLSYGSSRHLLLSVDNNEVQLGKPIQATITAHNIKLNLSGIKTEALQKNFGVYVIENSTKFNADKSEIQYLVVSLYPQRSGDFEIPALKLGRYSTKPLSVTVLPAIEDNTELNFSTSISSLSTWQRQQVIVTTSVITASKFAKITLDDFSYNGIESYALAASRTELNDGKYRLTAGWVLYPFNNGIQNINLPSVDYRLKGKVQRKFIPQNVLLDVKALPPYIPPLMPVGKITVNKSISQNTSGSGSTHILDVSISSKHALPSSLPSLPRDYIVDGDITTTKTTSTLTTPPANTGFSSSIQHRMPISFNASGSYQFPELVYKYFEPSSGKIVTIKNESINIIILSPLLKLVLTIALIIILVKILTTAIRYISAYLQRRNRRIIIINSVLDAQSPQELHRLLNEYAKTYRWKENMTLEKLQATWQANKKSSSHEPLNELSRACYSAKWDRNNLPELNRKIYSLLKT